MVVLVSNQKVIYPNACWVIKAPPARMNMVSIKANVSRSLLNKVIVLLILLSVRQVKKLPMRPKLPTKHTTIPEEMKRILSKVSSSSIVWPQIETISAWLILKSFDLQKDSKLRIWRNICAVVFEKANIFYWLMKRDATFANFEVG